MFIRRDEFPLPYEYAFFRVRRPHLRHPRRRRRAHDRLPGLRQLRPQRRRDRRRARSSTSTTTTTTRASARSTTSCPRRRARRRSCGTSCRALDVALTPAIAEALYVGLVTDTGRFMYENTGPRAHVMAADLIAAGVDVHEIYRRLYEGVPEPKLALLTRALTGVERYDDGRLTLARLDARGLRRDRRRGVLHRGHHRPPALGPGHEGRGARARADRPRTSAAARRSRCARPTARSTCRSSRARRAAAGTARPPASRRRWTATSSSRSCASRSPRSSV